MASVDAPESSKTAQRRQRRLQAEPSLANTSAIHPHTSHLIYPSPIGGSQPSPLFTPLFKASSPRSLPTPPVLSRPRDLSISPDGSWLVVFHPNPSTPGCVSEGGTLAIYPRSILAPTTTTSTIVPLTTFSLPSDPLATVHLYPPRTYVPAGRAPAQGPRPPPDHDPRHGPTFVILTSSSILFFHPQRLNPASEGPVTPAMNVISGPLHTRWHSTAMGPTPPENPRRAGRGWAGLVGGDQGVWLAYESKGHVGVVRAEVGVDPMGNTYLRTTPMPALPTLDPPTWNVTPGGAAPPRSDIQSVVQSVVFVQLSEDLAHRSEETVNGDVINGSGGSGAHIKKNRAGAEVIYQETASSTPNASTGTAGSDVRTRLELVGFERREVELAEGFAELSGEPSTCLAWDWFTMPNSLRTSLSPSGTTILSLAPVSAVSPHTLALALLSQPTGVSLVHLDLAPSPATDTAGSATWSAIQGSSLDLGEPSLTPAEMVLSQGAARGCLGLAAVISHGSGPMLLVPPKLQTSAEGADDIHVAATDAATSIFLAIRQGVSYADVIRAAFGSTPKAKHSELAVQILQGSHDRLLAQFGPTDLSELFKLQTAVFSATEDRRRDLAAELLRLWEAGQLFIACKQVRDGSLSFDLDTVWPLINFAEWVMGVLSRTMRECILQMGRIDWEGDASAPDASRVIYVLHPHLRRMVISLLAAIHAFSGFVLALEDPILPPESRLGGMTRQRDPRATLVAKDRVRDLGLAQGMEVMAWGKALEGVNIKAGLAESDLQTSLVTLDISPILPLLKPTLDILPSPSSLFRAEQAEVQSEEHDAITFLPIPQGLGPEGRLPRCDRCGWRTAGLAGVMGLGMGMGMGTGMGAVGMGMGMGQINGTGQETTAWEVWKKEREAGCGCGGTWVR